MENEYCAKRGRMAAITLNNIPPGNIFPSAKDVWFGQSLFDPFVWYSDDDEYLPPKSMAESTPKWCDCAAPLLRATRLYFNAPPEAPKNWGQINPNLNDYHSNPMEISSTFWLPDITDWWCQQLKKHSKYTDLSNVAHDTYSTIPDGIGAEPRFSFGRDIIGWSQSKTTGETLWEGAIVR